MKNKKFMNFKFLNMLIVTISAALFILVTVPGLNAQQIDLDQSLLEKVIELEKIINQLNKQEIVGLIIEFEIDFRPEGILGVAQVNNQREEIAMSQVGILQDVSDILVTNLKQYESIPALALHTDLDGFERLVNHPLVKTVQYDNVIVPALGESANLVGAVSLWDSGVTGSGQVVVILDTGAELDHSFLAGKVVAEACFSSNTFQSTSLCPNGNNVQLGPGSGANCDSSINGCGHGTSVAGIAAGSGPDFNGVARDADIISIQVLTRFDDESVCNSNAPCIGGFISDLIAAKDYIHTTLKNEHEISSVNISLGGDEFTQACDQQLPSMKAVVDNLRSDNIATIAASGNEGLTDAMSLPACISSVISVGSTTKNDNVSTFSNSADFLDLLAPGQFIISSDLNNQFRSFSGTSMAAPHVAGAWALMKESNPDASVSEILDLLKDIGVPIADNRNGITTPRLFVDLSLIIDSELSSVSASPGIVLANGIEQSTITVNVRSSLIGDELSNIAVALSPIDNNSNINIVQDVTDQEGNAFFTVSHTVAGLATYRVTAGNVLISESLTVDFRPVPPNAVAAEKVGAILFTAKWGSVSGATNYKLDVSSDPGFESFVDGFGDKDVGNVTEFEMVGLDQGTTYFYRVRAVTETLESDNSNTIDVTTLIINATNTEVKHNPKRVLATGVQKSFIKIIVVDDIGNAVEGAIVEVVPDGGSSVIFGDQAITGPNGEAVFSITNTFEEQVTYTIFAGGIELGERPTIEFLFSDGKVRLGDNFPNPFRTVTYIPVVIEEDSRVRLEIYNSAGMLVKRMVDEELTVGFYEFPFNPRGLSSGVYFYRLQTAGTLLSEKMLFVK